MIKAVIITIILLVGSPSFAKKSYPIKKPRKKVYSFKTMDITGRYPISFSTFIESRKKPKFSPLRHYRQNWRKKIRKSVGDL
jgi:hypothetical protein